MAITVANTSYPYGGSDWFFDPVNYRMVHRNTGQIVDLSGATNALATGNITTPSKTTTYDVFMDHIVREITKLSEQVGEYDALRIYLAANHKEILEQFDAAYAARKRIAVEKKP